MKTCPKCKVSKQLKDFYPKKTKTGVTLRSYCISCGEKERNKWRAENWEYANNASKKYNKKFAHIIRGNKLSKYWPGTTWEQAAQKYRELLDKQNGVCAICFQKETRAHKTTSVVWDLAVDHCHSTDKVRGLLCNACNRGLGLLDDTVEGITKALDYLKKAS